MNVQIVGTGTHNSGAELMACAIREWATQHRLGCVVDKSYGSYSEIAEAGFATLFAPPMYTRSGLMSALMSRYFRNTHGIVRLSEVSAVLDASGFAYGDQWGPDAAESLLQNSTTWAKRGIRVVLLPQSFGSFENSRISEALKRSSENIACIFARDQHSLVCLQKLDLQTKVLYSPDFTVRVLGLVPSDCELTQSTALIVPNLRMLDRGTDVDRSHYFEFLSLSVQVAVNNGYQVVALSHSKGDESIIENLCRDSGLEIPMIHERRPVVIKGLLGKVGLVVGSRFHALISAMLQGVPCIGTGWSHKYRFLFDDFGVPHLLLKSDSTVDMISNAIDSISMVNPPSRAGVVEKLIRTRNAYLQATVEMWSKVESELGLSN